MPPSILSHDDYIRLIRSLIFSALSEFGFEDAKILDEFSFKQYYSSLDGKQIFDVDFREHSAQFEIHRPGIEQYDQNFAEKLKFSVYQVIRPTLIANFSRNEKFKGKGLEIHRKLREPKWLRISI